MYEFIDIIMFLYLPFYAIISFRNFFFYVAATFRNESIEDMDLAISEAKAEKR